MTVKDTTSNALRAGQISGEHIAFTDAAKENAETAARGSERSEEPRGGEAVLLEQKQKRCDHPETTPHREAVKHQEFIRLHPHKCKSWYCPQCCQAQGIKTRMRLIRELEGAEHLQMWTFTIDPSLFPNGPRSAHAYVTSKRLIARVTRQLKKRGYLLSGRWFSVLEFQRNGMPHWHLLVEAEFVPIAVVQEIWDRFRPKEAGPVEEDRPAFGMLRFSAPKNLSGLHAARYVTKYLIKAPEEFPEWVKDYEGNLPRYTTSRGFWTDGRGTKAAEQEPSADVDPDWEPPAEPEYTEEENEAWEEFLNPNAKEKAHSTIGQRMERCKQSCIILVQTRTTFSNGDVEEGCYQVSKVRLTYNEALQALGFPPWDIAHMEITREQMDALRQAENDARLARTRECKELLANQRRAA